METALQSSVWVASPEFAGWLWKRGFHWRKLWKKRWVALHGAEIVYMDKEPTLENSANMTITKAQITSAMVIDREDHDGNPNGFAIHINDGHSPPWYLRAETPREKKSWLMRLAHLHAIVKWLEDFDKVKVLGVGGTGIVYELLHKSNGSRFAMKEMEIKNKTQMQMAVSEAEMLKDIMENISHPNVMHIEKVFQVGSKFYLVFPLCTGGELYEHIIKRGHLTEHDAARIIRDLVSGLHALHSHDILHLDIKPENILFDSMDDDAKIKITDFGLSRVFTDTQSSQQEADRPTAELMKEKLKQFMETGELNRERLRGTVGYMSPELILTGSSSKATDVFATGVVLYILLSGRPPFYSKSNRETLEKTVKGVYRITGGEWDDISEEAKELVKRMLANNPDERISTSDILNHSWIKQLDDLDDSKTEISTNGSSEDNNSLSPSTRSQLSSRNTSLNQNSRKNTGQNLVGALRQLSGHVRKMRSEKLAMSVTRLVSVMHHNGSRRSTLADIYLIPAVDSKTKASAGVDKKPQIAEKDSDDEDDEDSNASPPKTKKDPVAIADEIKANTAAADEDALKKEALENNGVVATVLSKSYSHSSDDNEYTYQEDDVMLLMSSNVKDALSAVFNLIGSEDGNTIGKLTIEQFLCIMRHFGFAPPNVSTNVGLPALLLCRFIDRDSDGYISADDIMTSQALVLQKSELFLKVVFRMYTEAVWYPGRQLNLINLLQHTPLKGNASATGNNTSSSSNNNNSNNSNHSSNNRNSTSFEKDNHHQNGTNAPLDVVEPPKFITGRHVAAVFERLGYDSACGHKVFTILHEAVTRLQQREREEQEREDAENSSNILRESEEEYDSADEDQYMEDLQSGSSATRHGSRRQSASKMNRSSINSTTSNRASSAEDGKKKDSSPTPNAALAAAFGAVTVDDKDNMSTRDNVRDSLADLPADAPLYSSTSNPRDRSSFHSRYRRSSDNTNGGANTANSTGGDTNEDILDTAAAAAGKGSAAGGGKMDFNTFFRAVELDDVLIQVLFRKPRSKILALVKKADTIYLNQHQKNDSLEATPVKQPTSSTSTTPSLFTSVFMPFSSGAKPSITAETSVTTPLNTPARDHHKRDGSRTSSTDFINHDNPHSAVAKTLNSTEIVTSLFEEELRAALLDLKSDSSNKPTFPIASAVGRVTLNAAIGFAKNATFGAKAFMEATKETLEGLDENEMMARQTESSRKSKRGSGTSAIERSSSVADDH